MSHFKHTCAGFSGPGISSSCDPLDCSPPDSSVHVIFQTRYWSELPFPSPGDLPDPGSNSRFLLSPALADGFFTTVPPYEVLQLNKWLWQIKLFLKGITFSDFSFHFLKIFFSISLLFFFFFFPLPDLMACGISVPRPGIDLGFWQ